MSPALMCASAEYQPSPSGYGELRSYTSSRCFLTELQQSRECARACLPESAARVQIIRARVCFLSCGSGSAVDVKRYWSPRCVQSVRYVSVPSTGSVINEGERDGCRLVSASGAASSGQQMLALTDPDFALCLTTYRAVHILSLSVHKCKTSLLSCTLTDTQLASTTHCTRIGD
ncbi:hypothetical protein DPX16_16351 [Anabarilius grahami]|uniref:Uncharacterized protein n=1 Tax=Anabarilius grahami TaxID=495550 RepID=A0A3N0XKD7_ANAGA|nr:hypothetical protein DPX16_16351 [Anabarilius grahami]